MLGINCTYRLGPPTFHIPLIPVADWPSRILSPFNIYSSLGRRANREGVYCGNTMVSRLSPLCVSAMWFLRLFVLPLGLVGFAGLWCFGSHNLRGRLGFLSFNLLLLAR